MSKPRRPKSPAEILRIMAEQCNGDAPAVAELPSRAQLGLEWGFDDVDTTPSLFESEQTDHGPSSESQVAEPREGVPTVERDQED